MHIICPHCRSPIELKDVSTRKEVACPACGGSFRLEEITTIGWSHREHEKLGRFELLEPVGVGSFGTVYKARDPELDRTVAIKVPRGSSLPEAHELDRFLREARSVAQLRHPSIVTVHEVGQVGNVPYLVSDFVEGLTLADLLSARRPTPREAAQLIADLADALQYAHEHGVIHRDIKPANIMLEVATPPTAKGEISAFLLGTPRLTDFGLAKREAGETTVTMDGQVLGTPAYMSPEQARGESHNVDGRTDVYSLGVILYQLLTGELPFRGTTRMLLHQVLHDEPRPPRKLNDHIPCDLETICLKAMAKEPHRRYQTARELSDDLRRFLTGEPIKARPVGKSERLWHWCRRNPRLAGLTAIVALLLVVIAVGASIAAALLRQERNRIQKVNDDLVLQYEQTDAERKRAEKAEHDRTEQLGQSLLREAQAARWSNRAGRRFESLRALTEAAKIARTLDAPLTRLLQLRNEAIACLALADLRVTKEWQGYPPGSVGLIFDGKLERYARSDEQGTISIRRVADDQEIMALPGPGVRAWQLQFSGNGQYLLAGYHHNSPKQLWVWDLNRREPVLKVEPAGRFDNGHDFSPDSRQVAVGLRDGTVRLYDLPSGVESKRLSPGVRASSSYSLRFHPAGHKLAIAGHQVPGAEIHDLENAQVVPLPHPSAEVWGIAWRADGKVLATAGGDAKVYLWAIDDLGRPVRILEGHQAQVVRVAFNRNGDLLASQSWDGTTRLWDPRAGWFLATTGGSGSVSFGADDRLLAYGRDGPTVWLWEVAAGRECRTFPTVGGTTQRFAVASVSIHPGGRVMASAGHNGVHLWDLTAARESDKQIGFLPLPACSAVHFHPDGQSLITSTGHGLHRWPVELDQLTATIQLGPPRPLLPDQPTQHAALSSDGRMVVVFTGVGRAIALDLETADRQTILESPQCSFAAISPDGKWIATGTWQGQGAKVWDARTWHLAAELAAGYTATVAFTPDGKRLVTSTGSEYRFWEVGSWQPGLRIPRHRAGNPGGPIVFTRDGRMLAIAYSSTEVRLIDPATGHELATLPTTGQPRCFTADGSQLVTTAEGGAVQVWDLRLIRQQLAAMDLDWNQDAYPPAAPPKTAKPLQAKILLGELAAALPQRTGSREERMRSAITYYRRLVAAKPEDAQACHRLAWLYAAAPPPLRDPAEALRLARKALELAPDQPGNRHTLGLAYFSAGQYRQVVETLQPYLKSEHDRYLALNLYLLAMSYHRLGNSARAQEYHALAVRWPQTRKNLSAEEAEILDAFRAEADALLSGKGAMEKK